MQLDKSEIKEIQQAFLDAFRSPQNLRDMILIELGENLATISAQNQSIRTIINELIEWAASRDKIEQLICGAFKFNPDNNKLRSLAEKYKCGLTGNKQVNPGSSQSLITSTSPELTHRLDTSNPTETEAEADTEKLVSSISVDTGGGPNIGKNVNTDRDFVGRDHVTINNYGSPNADSESATKAQVKNKEEAQKESKKPPTTFIQTIRSLPPILTGCAAIITAIGGLGALLLVLHQIGILSPGTPTPSITPTSPMAVAIGTTPSPTTIAQVVIPTVTMTSSPMPTATMTPTVKPIATFTPISTPTSLDASASAPKLGKISPTAFPAEGLVGHWTFDECAGVQAQDASGSNNTGGITGEITFTHDAVAGCALDFTGQTGGLTLRDTGNLEPATGTIEVWLKVHKTAVEDIVAKTTSRLVRSGKDKPTGATVYGLRMLEQGQIEAIICNDPPNYPPDVCWTPVDTPTKVITTDVWHHVVMRWNGERLGIFVDGILQASTPYMPIPEIGLSYSKTGSLPAGISSGGQMDELRIYNRALSDDEIRKDYLGFSSAQATDICAKVTEIPSTECETLIALYNGTDGPKWITKTNWLVINTPCSWYGVTCSPNNRNVIKIDLHDNHLNGSLPLELGHLTELESLDFLNSSLVRDNDPALSGPIPVELGNLKSLKKLSLSNNRLTGKIPSELGNLRNLTILALQVNQLDGSIPRELGNLSGLTALHLGQNHLTGGIPPELGSLQALQYLKLGDSGTLGGSIPSELGNLKQLKLLELTNTNLSGVIPPTLGNLSNLLGLSLQNNQLSGSIPEKLGQLTQLQCLQLNNNQLTGDMPVSLTQLTNLKGKGGCPFGGNGLDLGSNALTATDPTLRAFLDQKTSTLLFTDDFEENLVNWPVRSTAITATLVPTSYLSSKSAVQVESKNTKENPAIARAYPLTTTLGSTFKASIWCKAEANTQCLLAFGDDITGDLAKPEAQNAHDGNGEWQQLSVCRTLTNSGITLTENKEYRMTVYLYARTPNSKVLYDHLQIEQVSQCPGK